MKRPAGDQLQQTLYYYYSTQGGPTAAEFAKGCSVDGAGTWSTP
jgi:hypothetical protein